jgi:hypothetical protein
VTAAAQRHILDTMNAGPGHADEALASQSDPRVRQVAREGWDDLILPEREKQTLRAALIELDMRRKELVSSGSERAQAHEPRLTLLFAGVRGTGKTLATQLLADELGAEIVNVDLVDIASRDRGDAESQIDRAFAKAKESRALLVFDRADSLLDSRLPAQPGPAEQLHERGSAFEFSELVARSQRYPGVVVFTSWVTARTAPSLREGIDFVVEFPRPSSDARKQIWRRQLPPDARVDDVALSYLADSFLDPGATIRDCCVAATAAAAAEGVPVGTIHIGRALKREYRTRDVSWRTNEALTHLLEVGAAGGSPVSGAASSSGATDNRVAAAERPARPAATPTMPMPSAEQPTRASTPAMPSAEQPTRASAPTEPSAEQPTRAFAPAKLSAEQATPASVPAKPVTTSREPTPKLDAAPAAAAPTTTSTEATPEPSASELAIAHASDGQRVEPAPAGGVQARIAAALGLPPPATTNSEAGSAPSSDDAGATAARMSAESALAFDGRVRTSERPAAAERPRASRGGLRALVAVAGVLLAAGFGFAIARLTGGSTPLANASAGSVRIALPSGWQLRTVPGAQGRRLSDALAVGPASPARGLLVIGTSHVRRANALSRPLRLALSGRSRATVVTLGGLQFTRYPPVRANRAPAEAVYALRTTAGTVFGLCRRAGAAPAFIQSCEQVLATMTLTAGRVLPPATARRR